MDTNTYFVILKTTETFEEVVRLGKRRYRKHMNKYPNYCLHNANNIPKRFNGVKFEHCDKLPKDQFNFIYINQKDK